MVRLDPSDALKTDVQTALLDPSRGSKAAAGLDIDFSLLMAPMLARASISASPLLTQWCSLCVADLEQIPHCLALEVRAARAEVGSKSLERTKNWKQGMTAEWEDIAVVTCGLAVAQRSFV